MLYATLKTLWPFRQVLFLSYASSIPILRRCSRESPDSSSRKVRSSARNHARSRMRHTCRGRYSRRPRSLSRRRLVGGGRLYRQGDREAGRLIDASSPHRAWISTISRLYRRSLPEWKKLTPPRLRERWSSAWRDGATGGQRRQTIDLRKNRYDLHRHVQHVLRVFAFIRLADADPRKNPNLVMIDAARNGAAATEIAVPRGDYWMHVERQLRRGEVSPAQVQSYGSRLPSPVSLADFRKMLAFCNRRCARSWKF